MNASIQKKKKKHIQTNTHSFQRNRTKCRWTIPIHFFINARIKQQADPSNPTYSIHRKMDAPIPPPYHLPTKSNTQKQKSPNPIHIVFCALIHTGFQSIVSCTLKTKDTIRSSACAWNNTTGFQSVCMSICYPIIRVKSDYPGFQSNPIQSSSSWRHKPITQ